MLVGDDRFNKDEIQRLYDDGEHPLRKSVMTKRKRRDGVGPLYRQGSGFRPPPGGFTKGLKTGHCH